MNATCSHTTQIAVTEPDRHVCDACVARGQRWVHLRMCLVCGNVGCCDDSPNKHASAHFKESGHPLMRSIEPGERWVWCYLDEAVPGELAR